VPALALLTVRNRERGSLLGSHVGLADGWWTRLKGLLGRPGLEDGEGLLITDSQGVHMWWMKFPLDVALLDEEGRVVALYKDLQPGKRTRMHWNAKFALEVPVGMLDESETEEGDLLEWESTAAA
jgi:uncharacterized membrane protein (UPF0127 family)